MLDDGHPHPRQRAEGVVQVLILLTVGGMAAAASFTHVHDVAAAHGQPGWLGLGRRHRARTDVHRDRPGDPPPRPRRPPGRLRPRRPRRRRRPVPVRPGRGGRDGPWSAGWPPRCPRSAFLALVKIVLSRPPPEPGTDRPAPSRTCRRYGADRAAHPQDESTAGRDADLLDQARTAAAEHLAEHGRPITRDQLRAALRTSSEHRDRPASPVHPGQSSDRCLSTAAHRANGLTRSEVTDDRSRPSGLDARPDRRLGRDRGRPGCAAPRRSTR